MAIRKKKIVPFCKNCISGKPFNGIFIGSEEKIAARFGVF
jgi:hypothetical protein